MMRIQSPACSEKVSKAWRRAYIESALAYREAGNREDKRLALHAAKMERLNQRFFLGETPF